MEDPPKSDARTPKYANDFDPETVRKLKRYVRVIWNFPHCTAVLALRDGGFITRTATVYRKRKKYDAEWHARTAVALRWLEYAEEREWSTTPTMLAQAKPSREVLNSLEA